MGSSFEGLTLPVRIVPAVALSDDEFISFSHAHEPYRFEKRANGEIIMMTPVGREGGKRELRFAVELDRWAERDGRGEVDGSNTGWNLPDGSTLSPDASWTFKERLAGFTADERERFLPICPDFVAEIRSKSDSLIDQQAKMDLWMVNGAQVGWLIDPFSATVYTYSPAREVEVLHKPNIVEGEDPIAGFRLEMEPFWT